MEFLSSWANISFSNRFSSRTQLFIENIYDCISCTLWISSDKNYLWRKEIVISWTCWRKIPKIWIRILDVSGHNLSRTVIISFLTFQCLINSICCKKKKRFPLIPFRINSISFLNFCGNKIPVLLIIQFGHVVNKVFLHLCRI